MAGQPLRTPIDVAPRARPRPTLALILGLLAVPGSTLAWDLPAGGLYIGLPLALAAIVLGSQARSNNAGKRRATVGIVLAGLCILQMVIWTAVSLVS
jgi:hypothetical protein